MKINQALRELILRAEAVRVRNALNPTLWSIAVATPAAWVAAYFMSDTSAFLVLISIGCIPIILHLFQSVYFTIRNPKMLQSEEYLLQHQKLLIQSKSGQTVDPDDLIEGNETQLLTEMRDRDEL